MTTIAIIALPLIVLIVLFAIPRSQRFNRIRQWIDEEIEIDRAQLLILGASPGEIDLAKKYFIERVLHARRLTRHLPLQASDVAANEIGWWMLGKQIEPAAVAHMEDLFGNIESQLPKRF